MEQLATWQWIAIAASALVFVGGMQVAIFGYLFRKSSGKATARPGTDLESMLFAAEAPAGAEVFDGFSYRVSARFAGRARVVIDRDRAVVCGPRGPRGLYVFWIWLQGTLMALAPVALVWAAVTLDWRMLLWSLAALVAAVLVMAIGAGVWPGLGEVSGLEDGHMPALEFRTSEVSDVTLGPGWANGGLALVLLLYVGPINQLATDHAVSWWGPDETGREVRYGFHCYQSEDAKRLFAILSEAATRAT